MVPEMAQSTAVRKTLQLGVPIEKAFQVFTEKMGSWWPATHHVGKTPFKDIVMDPRAGGRWYEINAEGVECPWGTVLSWEPPKRVVLSWHLQPDFSFSPDIRRSSEVALEFIAEGPEATRVEFEHRNMDRHGEGWQALRTSVDSGWGQVLAQYVAAAK